MQTSAFSVGAGLSAYVLHSVSGGARCIQCGVG